MDVTAEPDPIALDQVAYPYSIALGLVANPYLIALDLPWQLDPTIFGRKHNVSHGAPVSSTVHTL